MIYAISLPQSVPSNYATRLWAPFDTISAAYLLIVVVNLSEILSAALWLKALTIKAADITAVLNSDETFISIANDTVFLIFHT